MLEVCCGSYEDALAAYRGGAKRIELNSGLFLGGLTPSVACLKMVKRDTDLQVISMVRPRGAGFCYSKAEVSQMFEEAEELLRNGSDGIAFGFLTEAREIDEALTEKMISLIHRFGKEAVFHRAFDCVKDPYAAAETLIRLKADRILTSGLREKAENGIALLKELQEMYGSRIELLAGSGIGPENAGRILRETGIRQVHSSCKSWGKDVTTKTEYVSYAFLLPPHETEYDRVEEETVKRLVKEVQCND